MTDPAGHAGDGAPLDEAARQRLVDAAPILRRVAPGLMGPVLRQRCRTSDLVQSALADALAALPSFRGERDTEFVGWTLRILEHNALDRRRRMLAERRSVDREQADDGTAPMDGRAAGGPTPSQTAIDRDELARMARAMRRLPEEQRRVLHLVALRGRSHAEAAAELGRSEGACRVLLARARANLLVCMARLADGSR